MTGLLVDVGRQLAERWVSVLVLPGLLLTGELAVGLLVGQGDALSADRLVREATDAARRVQEQGGAAVALAALALLLAAGALGLAAQGAGRLVRAAWLGDWPWWARSPRERLARRRLRRWQERHAEAAAAAGAGRDPSPAARRRNRISLAPPVRPTWMGDRLAGADVRVFAEYELDLASCWPRLWLVLPSEVREELRTASGALDASTVLAGWAVLYALGGALWWPSAVAAVCVWSTAWVRGRGAVATFADLIESAVDLHGAALGAALGLGPAGAPAADAAAAAPVPLTPELGAEITARCRKGA